MLKNVINLGIHSITEKFVAGNVQYLDYLEEGEGITIINKGISANIKESLYILIDSAPVGKYYISCKDPNTIFLPVLTTQGNTITLEIDKTNRTLVEVYDKTKSWCTPGEYNAYNIFSTMEAQNEFLQLFNCGRRIGEP